MQFGSREKFEYLKCNSCGLLWIKNIPENLGDYYPDNYFSFKKGKKFQNNIIRHTIDLLRVKSELNQGKFHIFTNKFIKRLDYLDWIKYANLDQTANILDIGCGSGKLLQKMRLGGFANTQGLDPFIEQTIYYNNGLTIHKQELEEFAQLNPHKFDLIMLHHSYEHMSEPAKVMDKLAAMLSKNGLLLIRIPLCDSLAWERYHENWAHLDAPRHLFLHTKKSLKTLAEKSGLTIKQTIYDSAPGQFTSSELYAHDVAWVDSQSSKQKVITTLPLDEFKRLTDEANATEKGDMAAFYLRHSDSSD